MMELVNKMDVLNEFCAYCDQGACDGGGWQSIQACWTSMHLRDILDDIAPIEAKPVVHAKWDSWIEYENEWVYRCTNCNYLCYVKTPHCPHCGARMDGDI